VCKFRIEADRIPGKTKSAIRLYQENGSNEDKLIFLHEANIAAEPARESTVARVIAKNVGVDENWLRGALENLVLKQHADQLAAQAPAEEFSAENLVLIRPSIYAGDRIALVVVPTSYVTAEKELATRWDIYVQYADGRRERLRAEGPLDFGTDRDYCLRPCPTQNFDSACTWAPDRRQLWLDGAEAKAPSTVLALISTTLEKYITFPGNAVQQQGWQLTLALWILTTYIVELFNEIPYLRLTGPTASGKTRCLDVLEQLCFRPVRASSISPAVLYRISDDQAPTILIDEAESLGDPGNKLLYILNAGYKKGGQASRMETRGQNEQPLVMWYHCYGCKAFASINSIPSQLESRSITLRMFRSGNVAACRAIDAADPHWAALRADLHETVLAHGLEWSTRLRALIATCPFTGREREKWGPLFAMARWIEEAGLSREGLAARLLTHAEYAQEAAAAESFCERDRVLLQSLADCLLDAEADDPRPLDLLRKAKEADLALFKNISAAGVAAVCRRYGIRTRQGEKHVYTVENIPRLLDVQREYNIPLGVPSE
jgi:hypothetical protein